MSTAEGHAERLAGNELALQAAATAATAWQDGGINEGKFPADEVEEAFWEYVRRANANNWDAWVDLFTEDVLYIDHAWGVRRGREEVRKWMLWRRDRDVVRPHADFAKSGTDEEKSGADSAIDWSQHDATLKRAVEYLKGKIE